MSDHDQDGHAAKAVEYAANALAESGAKVPPCPNCTHALIGPYCAVCGQERDTHRRSVWGILKDFFEDLVSFDSRILRTVFALLVEPGEIAIAFREGRTRRYVPALRLYFFVSLIFFLLLSATNLALVQLEVTATPSRIIYDAKGNAFVKNPAYDPSDPDLAKLKPLIPIPVVKGKPNQKHYSFGTNWHFFAPIGKYHSTLTADERDHLTNFNMEFNSDVAPGKKLTAAQKKKADQEEKKILSWIQSNVFGGIRRIANDPAALNGPMTTWIPRALFLLMPLYALLLAAFYWRQRRDFYFVDHLIFSLTVHAFTFVALIGAAVLAQVMTGGAVAAILCVAIGIYIFIGMKRFYNQGWFITTMKFGAVSFIYTFFFLIPSLAGILIWGFLGGPSFG